MGGQADLTYFDRVVGFGSDRSRHGAWVTTRRMSTVDTDVRSRFVHTDTRGVLQPGTLYSDSRILFLNRAVFCWNYATSTGWPVHRSYSRIYMIYDIISLIAEWCVYSMISYVQIAINRPAGRRHKRRLKLSILGSHVSETVDTHSRRREHSREYIASFQTRVKVCAREYACEMCSRRRIFLGVRTSTKIASRQSSTPSPFAPATENASTRLVSRICQHHRTPFARRRTFSVH